MNIDINSSISLTTVTESSFRPTDNNNIGPLDNEHPIYQHIHLTWERLRFTHEDLFLGGADQPLIAHSEGKPFYIYISEKEDIDDIKAHYAQVKADLIQKINNGDKPRDLTISPDDLLELEIRVIPRNDDGSLAIPADEHGLLHIPFDAFSPGEDRFKPGIFFNWDSAKMIKGMCQDGMVDSAKMMLDNLLYEIDHYGGPLNANGTFSLTDDPDQPRCQPPLIASKVMIIYNLWDELDFKPEQDKDEWLKYALDMLENHHKFWMSSAHFHEETGLSKYGTTHSKPAAEVLHCEPDHFKHAYDSLVTMYENVKGCSIEDMLEKSYQDRKDYYYVHQYLKFSDQQDSDGNQIPEAFLLNKQTGTVTGLTDAYFQADTIMRETGLDATRRWGFMAADVMNLLPHDLNCYVAKQEEETARLYEYLNKSLRAQGLPENPTYSQKTNEWDEKAQSRITKIRDVFWDDGTPQFDGDAPYNLDDPMPPCFRDRYINPLAQELNLGEFRRYNFIASVATGLWTGAYTEDQAHTVVTELLPLLLREHGVATSTRYSGYQWDGDNEFSVYSAMLAEGLERYDYYHLALEVRLRDKNTTEHLFEETGKIWEKRCSASGTQFTDKNLTEGVGYSENDTGFGWTITSWIDAVRAIPRLIKKINQEYLPKPCVSTNFVVKEHGFVLQEAKDSPEMVKNLYSRSAVSEHVPEPIPPNRE